MEDSDCNLFGTRTHKGDDTRFIYLPKSLLCVNMLFRYHSALCLAWLYYEWLVVAIATEAWNFCMADRSKHQILALNCMWPNFIPQLSFNRYTTRRNTGICTTSYALLQGSQWEGPNSQWLTLKSLTAAVVANELLCQVKLKVLYGLVWHTWAEAFLEDVSIDYSYI